MKLLVPLTEPELAALIEATSPDKTLHMIARRAALQLTFARSELEKLKRGEFVCSKCGLRNDDDYPRGVDF